MELRKIGHGRIDFSFTAEDCTTLAEVLKAAGPKLEELDNLDLYSRAATYAAALEGAALASAAILHLSPKESDHYRAELGDLGISELVTNPYPGP